MSGYGDGPIDPGYLAKMEAIAQTLDEFLNDGKRGRARETGFILMVYPYGEREGRCNYISNGARREDVVKLLREQAARFEESLKK